LNDRQSPIGVAVRNILGMLASLEIRLVQGGSGE